MFIEENMFLKRKIKNLQQPR